MQVTLNSNKQNQSFTAIRADKVGRALLEQRMKQTINPAEGWEEIVRLIEKHKDNANDLFITKGNGDGGLGITIINRKNGLLTKITEGPLKIDSPVDLLKKAIQIGEDFNKNIRDTHPNNRVKEILDML